MRMQKTQRRNKRPAGRTDTTPTLSNRLLYRVLTVVVALLLLLCAAGALYLFTDIFSPPQPPRVTKGVLLHKDSGEETAYLLEILEFGDIESEFVRLWIDDKSGFTGFGGMPVYHTLYNDDLSEPIEMYLYMPLAREVMGDIGLDNIRVSESGTALVLDIETNESISRVLDGSDLILHIYIEETGELRIEDGETGVRTERLYVNGVRYNCPGATFTQFSSQ